MVTEGLLFDGRGTVISPSRAFLILKAMSLCNQEEETGLPSTSESQDLGVSVDEENLDSGQDRLTIYEEQNFTGAVYEDRSNYFGCRIRGFSTGNNAGYVDCIIQGDAGGDCATYSNSTIWGRAGGIRTFYQNCDIAGDAVGFRTSYDGCTIYGAISRYVNYSNCRFPYGLRYID